MKKFRKILAAMLAAVSVMTMAGMPCLAWGEANLLPGGSFEEETFAEGQTENNYTEANSGSFAGGTWNYSYNGVASYFKTYKEGNEVVAEVWRGAKDTANGITGSGATLRSTPFAVTKGDAYRFSYDIANTHNNKGVNVSLVSYDKGEDGTPKYVFSQNISYLTVGKDWIHVEHYFKIPVRRNGIGFIDVGFSSASTSCAFKVKNISLTACADPVVAYSAAAQTETFTAVAWCKADPSEYGTINTHTLITAGEPVFTVGTATKLYQTVPEEAATDSAEYTVIVAQYADEERLVAIDILTTESADVKVTDTVNRTLRHIKAADWSIDDEATFYKVFYRTADGTLLAPLAGKSVYTGTITPAS